MFCKFCGKEIDNESSFCQFCGKPISITIAAARSEKNPTKSSAGVNEQVTVKVGSAPLSTKEELERLQGKKKPIQSFLIKIGIALMVFLLVAWSLSGRDPVSNVAYVLKKIPQTLELVGITKKGSETADSKAEFMRNSKTVDFDSLDGNPDSYSGEKINVSGQVFQVIYEVDSYYVLISTDEGDDSVLIRIDPSVVDYDPTEGDTINVYGVGQGEVSYENLSGETIYKPLIDAKYIEVL
jgi:hypothetical protein